MNRCIVNVITPVECQIRIALFDNFTQLERNVFKSPMISNSSSRISTAIDIRSISRVSYWRANTRTSIVQKQGDKSRTHNFINFARAKEIATEMKNLPKLPPNTPTHVNKQIDYRNSSNPRIRVLKFVLYLFNLDQK